MKLFHVLISCVFVNVSADIITYKRVVAITNLIMQNASDLNGVNGNDMSILFAVPEKADLENLQDYIDQQIDIQLEMIDVLFLPIPDDPGPNFGNENLSDLGKARRCLTGTALKRIISSALDRYDLDITLSELCRFVGLWLSTKIPTMFIKSAFVDADSCCVLKNEADHITKYKFIGDSYWQVDAENINFQIIQLKLQLEEELC